MRANKARKRAFFQVNAANIRRIRQSLAILTKKGGDLKPENGRFFKSMQLTLGELDNL
jgi:hypothetical protein